jgi:threonine/homoserine/homoserine lactone efflux protein
MGRAIGDFLPAAVGVAISPLPIIAVVLMLTTPRGRANGLAYLIGSVVGVVAAGTILLLVASGTNASDDGQPADWVGWLKLVLGAAMLFLALKQWRGRPRSGAEAVMPAWMGALDSFTPPKAAAAGVVLSAINPKNLVLIVAGAASIAQAGLSGGEQAVAFAVFTLIASIGVGTPVVISFALGDRAVPLLDRLKAWLAQNNALIMAVVLLVIGAKLIGDGISALS